MGVDGIVLSFFFLLFFSSGISVILILMCGMQYHPACGMRIVIFLAKGYPGCLQRLAARVFGLLRNTCWPAANETKLHEASEKKPLVPRVGKGWTTRKVMGGG